HLAHLARFHALLGEAETVDLVEVGADLRRRDIVGRLPEDLARGLVGHPVMHGRYFADAHLDLVLLRLEAPGQPGADIRIEAYGERAAENLARRRSRHLRGAAETRDAAEPGVERHRRIGRADHAGDQRAAAGGDQHVTTDRLLRSGGHIGRTRTMGPLTNVIT